jgi:hypothetical protein
MMDRGRPVSLLHERHSNDIQARVRTDLAAMGDEAAFVAAADEGV